jgi:DNA polymerase-3 subunit delta
MARKSEQEKKKKEKADYQRFKNDLSKGNLGSLYLFYGEEVYLRDYYLEAMEKKLIPAGMGSFNYHALPGKNLSLDKLSAAVDALPMMSQRTMVVVTDYDLFKAPEKERTQMTQLLLDLPDYCCLVFLYDLVPFKIDARMKKLAGAVQEKGLVVHFDRPEKNDLLNWIGRRFRALGHDIDSATADYLIFKCGDLMTGLIPEIGKIGAYAKDRRVTRQDIDAVAIPLIEAKVFEMTDALNRKDFDTAFSVLTDLRQLRQEPIMILAVLGKHFRQLYSARVALESRKGSRWLMELWGMRSTYPADKLMEGARRHDLAWCRYAMARCAQTDLAMKSVSGADSEELLLNLLLELAGGGAPC